MAFLDYRLAQELSPAELAGRTTFTVVRLEPGADAAAVRSEICRRLPYNDVYSRLEWASKSRVLLDRKHRTRADALRDALPWGALVGVVIVAQTLYASTIEHLSEFGTVKAIGGRNLTVYGMIAEQASFAAVLGFSLALAISLGLVPALAMVELKMIVSPAAAALVFLGTQVLCLGAAILSFRKVASLDPAMVFRG